MRVSTLIIVLSVAMVVAYFVWQLVNSKRAGQSRRTNQKLRASDKVSLKGAEKAAYRQAQKLYQEGNFRGSSKILESMGMVREAITVLEKAGFIREAADTLIRIQRPNRAGSLLARNGMWKEAMDCFKKANLPLEVGRCARELGDLPTAIPYFLEAKAHTEAAECYLELGKYHEAARLFFKTKEFDRAIEQYINFVDNTSDLEKFAVLDAELEFIQRKIVDEKADLRLADILIAKKRLPQLMIDLIRANDLRSATTAYMRNTTDIGPELIGYSDFKREENAILGSLFMNVGAYEYSGMVFERMEEFNRAGEAFEKGEFYERALFCYERSKNKQKVIEMRISIATHGSEGPKPGNSPATPVANNPQEPKKVPALQVPSNSNPFKIDDTSTDVLREAGALDIGTAKRGGKGGGPTIPPANLAFLGAVTQMNDEDTPVPAQLPKQPEVAWDPFYRAEFLVDLSLAEQKLLQKIAVVRDFHEKEVILDYNHTPQGIYFLLKGKVGVFKGGKEGNDSQVDELQPADTFGELWLLRDQPTKVKFAAVDHCILACIKRAEFEQLMDENGSIARKLYKRYAQKLLSKLLNEQNRLKKKAAS